MKIERKGHAFTVIKRGREYLAVMILSRHDNRDDAVKAMIEAMRQEGKENHKAYVEEMKNQGITVVTVQEHMAGMTPEERAAFLKERHEKFVMPLLNKNIEELEKKAEELKAKRKIKRVK